MNRYSTDRLLVHIDENADSVPLSLALEQARQRVANERAEEAADLFLSIIETMLDAGFLEAARNVLAELENRVVADTFPTKLRARFLHVRGGILSRLGLRGEARAIFAQLGILGEQVPDRQITATAELNLANQAFYLDELEIASQHYRTSLQAYFDLGNYYQAAHVVMSLAGVAQKQRDLLKVESLLASAEDLLRHMRKVPMLRFAWALARGQEAAATRNFPVALTFLTVLFAMRGKQAIWLQNRLACRISGRLIPMRVIIRLPFVGSDEASR